MPKLVFKVGSDWEEVVRLRNEIVKLKQELKSMDSTQSPAAFKALNTQLSTSTQRMDELVNEAAKAGAVMEGDFKKKIFDASQSVNGFTEKIITQKAVVKDIEADVRRLGDAYRIALKRNPLSASGKLEEYNAARKALDEEKAALFGLTQEQANARLSVKKLRDEYTLYNNDGKQVAETNNGITISWKKALAVIGGAGMLKSLISDVTRVRMEIDSVEKSFESLLKSEDKAKEMIGGLKELSIKSGLNTYGAAQTLLGFNVDAEKIIPSLKSIGDITMGNNEKFSSMTLAFAQMSAAGRLMGQDLNQMINAGFNPLQVISEKTGKSIAVLKKEMEQGAISSEMVADAFATATAEGGRFYNMLEKQNTGIRGEKNKLNAVIKESLNEIGEANEGLIAGSYRVTTKLIENYETIGKVVTGLVATYGTYRTAIMLVTAAESKHTLVEIGLTNVRVLARKAQLALNAAMLTNPYVLLAVAAGGLATAMWAMSDSTTAAARAQKEYNDTKNDASKKEQEHKQKIEELLTSARDESLATFTRQKSLEELRKAYPKIFEKYDVEKLKLADILKLKQQINEEDSKRSVQSRKDSYISLKGTIDEQKRYLSLIDNPKLQKSMSDEDKEMLRMYDGSKSYYRIKEELDKNSKLLKNYQKDVLDDNIATYKVNLRNYSKEKLEAELKMAQSSASKRNGFNVGGMMVKGGDLESIISSINGALAEKKSPTTYKQDYDKAKKEWEDAKKKLSEIEKDKSKFTSKQYEEAKKREETTEKAYKNLGGITGSSLTNQQKESDKQLKQKEKLAEDLLSLRRKNQQDEISLMEDGAEKKLAQIAADFEAQKQAIEKNAKELAKTNKEAGITDVNKNGLSTDQQSEIDKANKLNIDSRKKAESELYKAEADAMRDYLKEYGTFQQKKEAIAKEYADKIAKATTEGDKKILQKEMEEAIQGIDMSELKKSMDWEKVFGNLDKVSTDTLKRLKTDLKDFIATQKDLSPENLKELVDAIERIDDKVSERNPFETMKTSFKSLKDATDVQREAQKAYNKALKEGTDEEKNNAKATLESAKNSKQKALYEATTALHKGVDEIGQYVDAGNEVISIMETLGLNTPKWLEGTMSGFGEMLSGLGNIDLMKPMSIVTGSLQTIKGALTSITSLGGVINWNGSNAKEVQDSINRLTDRNEALQTSIESLTDEIKSSKGTKSVAAYRDAYDYQKEQDANYLDIAREQARYHSSHKSWQYYMKWSDEDLKWAQQNVSKDFNGTSSLWGLTPEEMEKLRSNVDIWSKMQSAGKGGYGERVTDKLDDYIEQAGKLEELTNALYEGLTAISFDSMYGSFIDNLMDMKYEAKDAAEDISEYFMRAMLSNKIGEIYNDKLEEWWKKFGASMEDNELTEDERHALQDEYMQYVEEAMKLRDKLAAATGYDKISNESYSQSSTSRGFGTEMTHEDAGELSGRFTALQIAGEEIKNQNIAQSQSLNLLTAKTDAILSVNTEARNIADDTRDLIANSYLELVQISENTGNSAKYLKDIKADIAEVKNNTSKL